MAEYLAPVRDIQFVLDNLVDMPTLLATPAFAEIDPSSMPDLLAEYGRFISEVFGPLNRVGDREHSRRDPATGEVRTPTGFRAAYQQYVDAGWGAVPFDPAHGGGGFPWIFGIAMQEILTSANMGFSLCPLLTQGAIEALAHHGTEEQQETYLRKMVSGEWTGTMNLTEPQAGSDVGALTTKAVLDASGTWRIFGQKIFITYGEHDMADNIIHLVLARVPNAPPGTKGISLFIVPKFLIDETGALGEHNDVRCVSVEHKMGINASPTCVMAYGDNGEGATGYLIGEANTGMRSMFTMMNNARLSVGLQGLAIAERAYQDAVAYATQRVQGRPVGGDSGDAIIGHPDVRRNLLTMRSQIEAMRGLVYLNAYATDMARHHPDADERARHQERSDLLTPLSKAWCTDLGVELTSVAVQIFGGMGFIEEAGVAQHYRDSRIAPIYEGTNGIQALDLIGRKLSLRGGAAARELLDEMELAAGQLADASLESAVIAVRRAIEWTIDASNPVDAMAGATPLLRALATTVGGWMMARQAAAAVGDDAYSEAKRVTAKFYAEQILPTVFGLCEQATAGSATLMTLRAEQFASQ